MFTCIASLGRITVIMLMLHNQQNTVPVIYQTKRTWKAKPANGKGYTAKDLILGAAVGRKLSELEYPASAIGMLSDSTGALCKVF